MVVGNIVSQLVRSSLGFPSVLLPFPAREVAPYLLATVCLLPGVVPAGYRCGTQRLDMLLDTVKLGPKLGHALFKLLLLGLGQLGLFEVGFRDLGKLLEGLVRIKAIAEKDVPRNILQVSRARRQAERNCHRSSRVHIVVEGLAGHAHAAILGGLVEEGRGFVAATLNVPGGFVLDPLGALLLLNTLGLKGGLLFLGVFVVVFARLFELERLDILHGAAEPGGHHGLVAEA